MLNLNINYYLEWIKTDEGKKFICKKQSNNNLDKNEIRNRNNYLN